MEYGRSFSGAIKNFDGLGQVRAAFLELASEDVVEEEYKVFSPEHEAAYQSLDNFLVSRFLPDATGCRIRIFTTGAKGLFIHGSSWDSKRFIQTNIRVDGLTEAQAETLVKKASKSLAITKVAERLEPQPGRGLATSVFIGYSFDGAGEEVADLVADFLRRLGFDVVTGEPFQANRVSDKVRELIRGQGVVVCIFTTAENGDKSFSEWVRDEATFAAALDKPLFILVEAGIKNIPGIHGDLEYIPFDSGNLASVFLKLLQGLQAIGFEVTVKRRQRRRGLLQRLLGFPGLAM